MTHSICFLFTEDGDEVLLCNVAAGTGNAELYNGIVGRRRRDELALDTALRIIQETFDMDVSDTIRKLGRMEFPERYLRSSEPTIYDFWSATVDENSPAYVTEDETYHWVRTAEVTRCGADDERFAGNGYLPHMVNIARILNGWID